jgi:hypothetical protein
LPNSTLSLIFLAAATSLITSNSLPSIGLKKLAAKFKANSLSLMLVRG